MRTGVGKTGEQVEGLRVGRAGSGRAALESANRARSGALLPFPTRCTVHLLEAGLEGPLGLDGAFGVDAGLDLGVGADPWLGACLVVLGSWAVPEI